MAGARRVCWPRASGTAARARRRGVDEALRSTPAPAQRRAAVEGGSLGLASASALVLVLVALLAGGCTPGPLSVGAVAVFAVAAAGFTGLALGRVFPAPMAAPLALFLTLVVASVFGGWTQDELEGAAVAADGW